MRLQNKFFPSFHLGKIILREQLESDVQDFFAYYSNPEVHRYILCRIPQNIDEAKLELRYWQRIYYDGMGAFFAIADASNNKMIGTVGVSGYNSQHRRIELSYDLAQDCWRQGIMSLAIKKVIDFAFAEMPINRIESWVDVNNIASKNLLLKCGFTLEGTVRQHRLHNNKFHDVYFFSFLRQDL